MTDRTLSVAGPGRASLPGCRSPALGRTASRSPTSSGTVAFATSSWPIDARALVPRPETELLVEAGLELPRRSARARPLHRRRRGRAGTRARAPRPAADGQRSECARRSSSRGENAARLGLEVAWIEADLLHGVPDEFDAVLANPPYVAEHGTGARSAPEILRHEPHEALFAGPGRARRDPPPARAARAERPAVRTVALEIGARSGRRVFWS